MVTLVHVQERAVKYCPFDFITWQTHQTLSNLCLNLKLKRDSGAEFITKMFNKSKRLLNNNNSFVQMICDLGKPHHSHMPELSR